MDAIAVVTGASRGAGKGIAIALGETGATVYVTGRSTADGDSPYGGTVTEITRQFSLPILEPKNQISYHFGSRGLKGTESNPLAAISL
jgi:NAD(P)-dependent dehydrogenase (short-subunit alcohol dehydrogenase family)